MVGFTAAAALIGVASAGYGLIEGQEGREKAEEGYRTQQQGAQIQAQAARDAAQISKDQAGSSVTYAGQEHDLNILASNQSVIASNASFQLNKDIAGEEAQSEAQRRQAMELEGRRSQLEIIRNQQRSRALGLATATGQGASKGSGLQGAYGQASGQTGVNLLGVQQNLEIGRNIFDNNATISGLKLQGADLENQYAVQQAANQTAKSNLAYDYAVTNAGYTNRQADVQVLSSQGSGLIAQGQGQVNIGNSQVSAGNSFLSAGTSIFSAGTNIDKLFGNSSFGLNGFNSFFGGNSPSGYGS